MPAAAQTPGDGPSLQSPQEAQYLRRQTVNLPSTSSRSQGITWAFVHYYVLNEAVRYIRAAFLTETPEITPREPLKKKSGSQACLLPGSSGTDSIPSKKASLPSPEAKPSPDPPSRAGLRAVLTTDEALTLSRFLTLGRLPSCQDQSPPAFQQESHCCSELLAKCFFLKQPLAQGPLLSLHF